MRKFKRVITGIMIASFAFSSTLVAYARDTDWTVGRSFTWSPYVSGTEVTSYSTALRAKIDFFFDEDGADENNSMYYFTMEENCGSGKKLILTNQYTNLPDPHFDADDDDGDGYEEESEAVEGDGTLNSSTSYYFISWWDKDDTTVDGGTLDFVTQNSIKNLFNGEYEAVNYDLLESVSYSAIGESRTSTQIGLNKMDITTHKDETKMVEIIENEMFTKQVEEGKNEIEITISPRNDIASVKEYKEYQQSKLNTYREAVVSRALEVSEGQATVTFVEPLSQETVLSIMNNSNAALLDCEIKLVNGEGTWITANVKDLATLDIEELVKMIADDTGEVGLTYCGVTSARVVIDVNGLSYELLSSNNNIYFVDMMDYILRNEYFDYLGDLDIRVFDMAWSIMN